MKSNDKVFNKLHTLEVIIQRDVSIKASNSVDSQVADAAWHTPLPWPFIIKNITDER